MKKFYFAFCALILFGLFINTLSAQTSPSDKKVIISYTWSRIPTHGSNQLAVWIENAAGNHIRTLFATRYTAKGGYLRRPLSLAEWTSKFNLKNASAAEVDAVSGATPQSGKQTLTWDGKDKAGKMLAAGTYVVRMEANIHDADKMFYRAEIKIGGNAQQTSGKITFTSTGLETGQVLFRDVLVEYK